MKIALTAATILISILFSAPNVRAAEDDKETVQSQKNIDDGELERKAEEEQQAKAKAEEEELFTPEAITGEVALPDDDEPEINNKLTQSPKHP